MKQNVLFLIALLFSIQFATAQSVTNGLASYYSFNDSTANDQMGDNHGIINGAVRATDRFGNLGNAMYFNGAANIKIGDSSEVSLNNMAALSISCWVKPDTFFGSGDLKGIVTKWTNNGATEQYGLYGNANSHLFAIGQVFSNGVTFSGSIVDSSWSHLVVVYDIPNTSLKYYINGVLVQSLSASAFPGSSGTSELYIGAQGTFRYYQGLIDDVAIYNSALDSTDVATLYNEVDPNLPSNLNEVSASSNTVQFYPNPSQGQIFFNSNVDIEQIELFNVAGQRLYSINPNKQQGSLVLDVENGLYILQSRFRDGTVSSSKIILQK